MKLSDQNIEIFCAQNYTNICCDIDEFKTDIKRIRYIIRLFDKYLSENNLKERLLLNHFISFFNVFTNNGGVRILFYFVDEKQHSLLKTMLIFLNRCPDFIEDVDINNIEINQDVLQRLNQI